MQPPPHVAIPPAITSPYLKALSQDELDVFLEETTADECGMDLLFLPRANEKLLQSFYSANEAPAYTVVFAETPYAELAQVSPWFFEVNTRHYFWHEVREAGLPWGALLVGKADEATAIGHWRSLLNVLMPDDTISHFRFYSPTVLFHVANACARHELAWLCGPNSHLVLPMPEDGQKPWVLVANPLLPESSAANIAASYTVKKQVWWHVTEEQLAPFKEKSDALLVRNLSVWLWRAYPAEARIVHGQEGDLRAFVEKYLPSMDAWGFQSVQQKQRCAVALLLLAAGGKPAAKAREILAWAAENPERALHHLEQLAGNQKGG